MAKTKIVPRTQIIHVMVRTDTYQQYKAIAESEDVPVSIVVRRALNSYLEVKLVNSYLEDQKEKVV